MTQRNEKDLIEARKAFYQNAKVQVSFLQIGDFAGMTAKFYIYILSIIIFAAKKGVPMVILIFASLYWAYGLMHYFDMQLV